MYYLSPDVQSMTARSNFFSQVARESPLIPGLILLAWHPLSASTLCVFPLRHKTTSMEKIEAIDK